MRATITLLLTLFLTNILFSNGVSANLEKAIQAENNNNFALAISYYKKVLKKSTNNETKIEILNNIGVLFYKLKNYSNAKNIFEKCLKINKDDPKIWNNIGLCFQKKGKFLKAENAFKRSLKLDNNFIDPILNLTNLYFIYKDYAKALKTGKKLLELNPLSYEVLYGIAVIYLKMNKLQKAAFYFEASLSLKPKYEKSMLELVSIYFELRDIKNFIKIARKLINIQPRVEILTALAYTYFEKGLYNNAIKYLNQALFISPNNVNTLTILETIYEKIKDFSHCLYIRKKLIETGHKSFKSYMKLAVYLHKLERYDEAISIYKLLLKKHSKHNVLINNLSLAYFAVNRYRDGLKILAKAKNNRKLKINLGWGFLRTKKYNKAINIFSHLVKQKPNDIRAKQNLYLALAYSGKIKLAKSLLFKLRKKNNSPYISLYLSWVFALSGNLKQALHFFEEALKLDGGISLNVRMDILQEEAFKIIKNNEKTIILLKNFITQVQGND